MADERVVATKLEQIEQYHGELKAKQQSLSREELLTDTTERRAVERMFENAVRACSDPAKHVASQDFDFDGHTCKEAIRVLNERDVIDEETTNTLVAAVGLRNVLAHEYGNVELDASRLLIREEAGSATAASRPSEARAWSPPPGDHTATGGSIPVPDLSTIDERREPEVRPGGATRRGNARRRDPRWRTPGGAQRPWGRLVSGEDAEMLI